MWRRLVARYLGVVEVVGSNPVTPTNTKGCCTCDSLFFSEIILRIKFAELSASTAGKIKEPIMEGTAKLKIKRRISPQLTESVFYFPIQKKNIKYINYFTIFTIKVKILTNIVV